MADFETPRVRLGIHGFEFSKLGYGCIGLSGAYNSLVSDEDGIAIIKYAFNKGITFFDTSDIYGVDHSNEILVGKVDMVIILASTGQMGVLPGHVATIAELKPGILSVHEGNKVINYFISSGFVFVHANSYADIIAVEAVPINQIDPSLVQKGLAEFPQKLNSATTDLEKAEAQIKVDVHSALNSPLSG